MTTSWAHKPTGTVIERSAIDALIKTYLNSPREHARKAAWRQLHVIGAQLNDILRDLESRLNRGYVILENAYDETKEAQWMTWLHSYEAACDALSEISCRVVEKRPDGVTRRRDEAFELRGAA